MTTQNRGMGFETEESNDKPEGVVHVLAIAINKYQKNWPDLKFPVSECEKLLEVLGKRYKVSIDSYTGGFLVNETATLKSVLQKFENLRRKDPTTGELRIKPEDSLIIIFSGHGYQDPEFPGPPGYLALADSKLPKDYSDLKELFNGDELVNILSHVGAKHILVIVDSCFSASLSHRIIELPDEIKPIKGNKSAGNPSRWILTSGRDELVPDKSLFANTLIRLLEDNQTPEISTRSLFSDIERNLKAFSCPAPLLDDLVDKKFSGGEFRFQLRAGFNQAITKLGENLVRIRINADEMLRKLRIGSSAYKKLLNNGRFRHINIEQVLLAETNLSPIGNVLVRINENQSPLSHGIISLWKKQDKHAVLFGAGGMGKTVSLLKLWDELLENQHSPIPIFIALNEYNQINREADKTNFIIRYIAQHYLQEKNLSHQTENDLWNLLSSEMEKKLPRIILLLDGFNEVTISNSLLIHELNRLTSEAKNVQLVVSSRYVEIQNYHWARSANLVELVPLTEDVIQAYLRATIGKIPTNKDLLRLMGNPMMLTIYAGSNSISTRYLNDKRFTFFPVQTTSELLWNFSEAHLAKVLENYEENRSEQIYIIFLIRYLIPFLGWKMEKEGQFFISTDISQNPEFNFNSLIGEACWKLRGKGALATYPDILKIQEKLSLKDFYNSNEYVKDLLRSDLILETLVRHLNLMVIEANELRFLHQNFRDFYAACHLRNCILFALAEGSRPEEWKEKTLPIYLRKMLGEIEGEYLFNTNALFDAAVVPKRITNNLISKLLDACRGKDVDEDYTVWNLINIYCESRGNLAEVDLNNIDCRKIPFSNMPFFKMIKGTYFNPNLNNAKIDGNQFKPTGESGLVFSILFASCGKKFYTSSGGDCEIKEWSVETGTPTKTIAKHDWHILKSILNKYESKILSGCGDNTINEWCLSTGELLKSFYGHNDSVTDVAYHPNRQRVLSASNDKTVKEWSLDLEECLHSINSHTGPVLSVRYSRNGKKILSGSEDGTIKEHSTDNYNIIREYVGHKGKVNVAIYSMDEEKIFSASDDGTVREWCPKTGNELRKFGSWNSKVNHIANNISGNRILLALSNGNLMELSVETGEILMNFEGHYSSILTFVYSPDGKKILSGAEDGTIKEWSTLTGECLKTIKSKDQNVSYADYSHDDKKLVTASVDHVVKEYSVKTKICINSLLGHEGPVYSAIYNKNGAKILSCSEDKSIREWDVQSGKCLKLLIGHTKGVNLAIYCPNYKYVYSTSMDNKIKKWDLISGKCIKTFYGHRHEIMHIVLNDDGKKILSSSKDGIIREWSTETGECTQVFKGHKSWVSSSKYFDYGTKIISCSWDQTFKEWLVETGECIVTHKDDYLKRLFAIKYKSPSGLITFETTEDGTIKEYFSDINTLIHEYKNEVGLLVHGLDLRHLHPDSKFTEEEKERLRRYGSIFTDEDEKIWKEALADAYGEAD
jgi:WD40 repeat protein